MVFKECTFEECSFGPNFTSTFVNCIFKGDTLSVLIFYAGRLVENDEMPTFGDIPEGAYLLLTANNWAVKNHGQSYTSVDVEDVPKELKLMARLVGR